MTFHRVGADIPDWPEGRIAIPALPPPATVADGLLPSTGPVTIGGVALPVGRPVTPRRIEGRTDAPLAPTLWVTDSVVPDAAHVWRRLVDCFPTTGLWPLLLRPLGDDARRPWDAGELDPVPVEAIDARDAAQVLADGWAGSVVPIEGPSVHPAIERALAPFGAEFPGLAAPGPSRPLPLTVETRRLVRFARPRIGLVPCRRPADAIGLAGWQGAVNRVQAAEVSSVLRSWEDRFGVVLAGLCFATMSLLVPRPPLDPAHGARLAVELAALCPDQLWQGAVQTLEELGRSLIDEPVRHLWFD